MLCIVTLYPGFQRLLREQLYPGDLLQVRALDMAELRQHIRLIVARNSVVHRYERSNTPTQAATQGPER